MTIYKKFIFILAVLAVIGDPLVFAIALDDKDENNNSVERVDIESKCAANILNSPTAQMVNMLDFVSKYALTQITKNLDYTYYPLVSYAPTPKTKDIIEYIEKKYTDYKNQNEDNQKKIFREYVNLILGSPGKENIKEKMTLIIAVGDKVYSNEYEDFKKAMLIMKAPAECPNTPQPRIARKLDKLRYFNTGIYALSPEDQERLHLKRRELNTPNGLNEWKPNEENCFVKALRTYNLPALAGPSGTIGLLINAAINSKVPKNDFMPWRILSAAFLVDGGHHSFAETMYASDYFQTKTAYHDDFLRNYDQKIESLKALCPGL